MALTFNPGPCCCAEGFFVPCCTGTAIPATMYVTVSLITPVSTFCQCILGTYELHYDSGTGDWLSGAITTSCEGGNRVAFLWTCRSIFTGCGFIQLFMSNPDSGGEAQNSSTPVSCNCATLMWVYEFHTFQAFFTCGFAGFTGIRCTLSATPP